MSECHVLVEIMCTIGRCELCQVFTVQKIRRQNHRVPEYGVPYGVPEYGVGGGEHDGLPLQQVEVPHPHRHAEREPVQEALEEPLEGVETSRDVLIQQVLLQPPQLLVKNLKLEMIRNSNL